MPAVVPIAVYAAASYLGYGAIVASIAAAAASAAISQRDKLRAKRIGNAQFNASLRDQTISTKGGVVPRQIVYGRSAVGGHLVFAETLGTKKEQLVLVFALAHGEVDAIETVYFNDVALTIDGSNNVTTAPYYISGGESVLQAATVPGSPYQVTLNYAPAGALVIQDGQYGWGSGDSGAPEVLTTPADYTVSGTTVTFNAARSGHPVQIGYEKSVTLSYAAIWKYTGAAGQDLSTVMLALGVPSWTSADKCQGMAALIVRLVFAENIWPAGVPNVKAVLRGRKVFDPRSSTTVWSANAALCARDYLTLIYGVNVAGGKLDDSGATNGAANICDEDVQLTSTPTYQDRYTVNGVIDTGNDRLSNLALFAESMAGSINYSQGKWRIRAGAYTAPALTLDENKLCGGAGDGGLSGTAGSNTSATGAGIQITPFTSRRDLINGAKGTYINAAAAYIEDQFPEWSSSAFITEDGGAALTTTLALPLITDSARAQRLAKIAVYRAREQLTLQVRCNMTAYTWQVGDMVSVTLARYGFSSKPFRIIKRGFSVEGGISLMLREEPSGLYDWNLGEATVLGGAGNTALPNPGVVAAPVITGIASGAAYLYKQGDGTMVARIRVAITSPADDYVRRGGRIQLQYKRGDWTNTDWVLIETDGASTVIWIDPAFDAQNYLIRARAVNSAGFVSAWTAAQAHACVGRLGQVVNLLLNSDFTEDLGYPHAGGESFADARALRNWAVGYVNAGIPVNIGRNYYAGTAWNIGQGGAWTYNTTYVAGGYYTLVQAVPVTVGAAYEASIYTSAHRCQLDFYLRWLNSSMAFISDAQGGPDTVSAGTGIVGGAYDPTVSHRRLWRSGTAPAGAAYAQLVLVKHTTTSGEANSFGFWSKGLLCVAPPGVTRETATPWVNSNTYTVDGGSITPGTVTDVLEHKPADSSVNWVNNNAGFTPSFITEIASVTYTNATPLTVPTAVGWTALVSWTNTGLQYGDCYWQVTVNGMIQNTIVGQDLTGTSDPTKFLVAGSFTANVPSGQVLVFKLYARGERFSPGTCNSTFYWKNVAANVQGIRK